MMIDLFIGGKHEKISMLFLFALAVVSACSSPKDMVDIATK